MAPTSASTSRGTRRRMGDRSSGERFATAARNSNSGRRPSWMPNHTTAPAAAMTMAIIRPARAAMLRLSAARWLTVCQTCTVTQPPNGAAPMNSRNVTTRTASP